MEKKKTFIRRKLVTVERIILYGSITVLFSFSCYMTDKAYTQMTVDIEKKVDQKQYNEDKTLNEHEHQKLENAVVEIRNDVKDIYKVIVIGKNPEKVKKERSDKKKDK